MEYIVDFKVYAELLDVAIEIQHPQIFFTGNPEKDYRMAFEAMQKSAKKLEGLTTKVFFSKGSESPAEDKPAGTIGQQAPCGTGQKPQIAEASTSA